MVFKNILYSSLASQVVLVVKNPPANAGGCTETGVQSLGQEDPLEEGTATHSSFLAWKNPVNKGYSPWGCRELDTTEVT